MTELIEAQRYGRGGGGEERARQRKNVHYKSDTYITWFVSHIMCNGSSAVSYHRLIAKPYQNNWCVCSHQVSIRWWRVIHIMNVECCAVGSVGNPQAKSNLWTLILLFENIKCRLFPHSTVYTVNYFMHFANVFQQDMYLAASTVCIVKHLSVLQLCCRQVWKHIFI